jgi:drug/metabolite transporter (DMT)-like permease
MKNTNLLFILVIIGMTFLSAATFIANRVLFADQPGLEDTFSLIWTVALGVILYKLLRFVFAAKATTPAEHRQSIYGALIYLIEVIAVTTLVIVSILFATTLTAAPGQNTQLILATAVVGLLALSIPVGIRLMRQAKQNKINAKYEPYDLL